MIGAKRALKPQQVWAIRFGSKNAGVRSGGNYVEAGEPRSPTIVIASGTMRDLDQLKRLLLGPRRRKIEAVRLLLLMLLGAAAEFAMILAVVPFLACLAHPTGATPAIVLHLTRFSIRQSTDAIVATSVLVAAVTLLSAGVRILVLRASQRFIFGVGLELNAMTYRAVLHQPLPFHLTLNSSAVLNAMQASTNLTSGLLLPLMQAMVAFVLSLFIVAAMVLVSPVGALVLVSVAATAYAAIALLLGTRLRRSGQAIALAQAARLKMVQEGMGGIRDVLIGSAQPTYLAAYEVYNTRLRNSLIQAALAAAVPRQLLESVGIILFAVLATAMVMHAGSLASALPTLGALVLGAQKLVPLFGQMFNGWAQSKSNRAALQQVIDYNALPLPVRAEGILPFRHHLELRSVRFAYAGGGVDVLRAVDLAIPKGTTLGIVGRTGAGKSTLLDLVLGLLHPTGGGLFVDGQEITPANAAAWQRNVAHVPQAIYLADVSIAENIAFGIAPAAIDRARLHDAVTRAGLDEVIRNLSDGYDSRVGERGVLLSGGQRQRIGIARALYRRASLLVLDEPTSALDAETEEILLRAIADLPERPTVLITAHRPSALRHCSRIYRIVGGHLVETNLP